MFLRYVLPSLLVLLSYTAVLAQRDLTLTGTVQEAGGTPIEFATILVADNTTKAALTGSA